MSKKDTHEHPLPPQPNHWQWGDFHNKNNQYIRYGFNCPADAKALIVLLEGRTETIEEYFELIRDLNHQGYACAIMDWQGQGMSYRHEGDNSRHHSIGFEQDISDFKDFLSEIAYFNLPKIMLAHSMGGNIGLRYLSDYPDDFHCAYLIAPMLGLNPKRMIRLLSRPLLKTMNKLKWLNKYALGQSRWSETFANIAKYKVSHDPIRRERQPSIFKQNPNLQCGGVTWGWLEEALKSISILHHKDICARITTPVFIAIAEKDLVVDNEGTMKTASLLPNVKTDIFKGAYHQIHIEIDPIRNHLLKTFYAFVEKHLP